MLSKIFGLLLVTLAAHGSPPSHQDFHKASTLEFSEAEAEAYLLYYDQEMSRMCNQAQTAEFAYNTDLNNKPKEDASTNATIELALFEAGQFNANISKFPYDSFTKPELKRLFKFLNAIGTSKLEKPDLEAYNQALSEMSKIYGTAKVCPFNKQDCNVDTEGLPLEPDLTDILSKLEDEAALAYYWKGWRDASGKKMRGLYNKYLDLSNKAAKLNGYDNMGDFWLLRYESETFRDDLEAVWQTVNEKLYKPLYDYVRFSLKKNKFVNMSADGPMEAHLFGNMWSQTWNYVLPYVLPYPNETVFDITQALVNATSSASTLQGKAEIMFDMADDFFTRTGLESMKEAYGPLAMIVKPDDGREVICHASAWDMCDKTDFRIKQCTEVNQKSFVTIHHELGHIQYYKQYKNLSYTYRTGANPGFHEAIGDVIALSVSSPKHLKEIGLLPNDPSDLSMLNYLMQMALEKVAFLPFGYLIDAYRWSVFNGTVPRENMNFYWVKMRGEYQGIVPPVTRSESDFDPGAKYHVPGNTPYIRYFVSFILQFQIHAKLCASAGHTGPLYNCDIYGNAAAGEIFANIMQKGGSQNWQQLLLETVGVDKLDPQAILDYFKPLTDYFAQQQALNNYPQGYKFNAYDYVTDGPRAKEEGRTAAVIIVGIFLGVILLVVLLGYFISRMCKK